MLHSNLPLNHFNQDEKSPSDKQRGLMQIYDEVRFIFPLLLLFLQPE